MINMTIRASSEKNVSFNFLFLLVSNSNSWPQQKEIYKYADNYMG